MHIIPCIYMKFTICTMYSSGFAAFFLFSIFSSLCFWSLAKINPLLTSRRQTIFRFGPFFLLLVRLAFFLHALARADPFRSNSPLCFPICVMAASSPVLIQTWLNPCSTFTHTSGIQKMRSWPISLFLNLNVQLCGCVISILSLSLSLSLFCWPVVFSCCLAFFSLAPFVHYSHLDESTLALCDPFFFSPFDSFGFQGQP